VSGAWPLPEEDIGRMVGDGAAVLVARMFAASGIAQPPDALARFLAIYDGRLLNHTRPYSGIRETLDRLIERAPLAVLTNKPIAATRRMESGRLHRRRSPRAARDVGICYRISRSTVGLRCTSLARH